MSPDGRISEWLRREPATLQAEFNEAIVGEVPERILPGPPVGDSLSIAPLSPGADPIATSAVTVAATGSTPPGLSLRAHVGHPFVTFQAGEARPGISNYLVTWTGASTIARSAELNILVMSGHAASGVLLKMRGGQFLVGRDEVPIGTYRPLEEHTVLIAVDLDAGSYNLTIHRTGASSLQVADLPLIADLSPYRYLELAFFWGSREPPTNEILYVDNVVITGTE